MRYGIIGYQTKAMRHYQIWKAFLNLSMNEENMLLIAQHLQYFQNSFRKYIQIMTELQELKTVQEEKFIEISTSTALKL